MPGYPRYVMVGNASLGQHHLAIRGATLQDDGQYECQVAPTAATRAMRATANVTVMGESWGVMGGHGGSGGSWGVMGVPGGSRGPHRSERVILSFLSKMTPNGPIWSQMAPNGPKRPQIVPNLSVINLPVSC